MLFRAPKYYAPPASQNLIMDETKTIVIGFELSFILQASGHTVHKHRNYLLPEGERLTYAEAIADQQRVSNMIGEAQFQSNLVQDCEAEMDALLAAENA